MAKKNIQLAKKMQLCSSFIQIFAVSCKFRKLNTCDAFFTSKCRINAKIIYSFVTGFWIEQFLFDFKKNFYSIFTFPG